MITKKKKNKWPLLMGNVYFSVCFPVRLLQELSLMPNAKTSFLYKLLRKSIAYILHQINYAPILILTRNKEFLFHCTFEFCMEFCTYCGVGPNILCISISHVFFINCRESAHWVMCFIKGEKEFKIKKI